MTDFGSRHKASHQDGGGDEIDCTGLVGRVSYVDRGDPIPPDWTQADLTTNGTWRDLDCSAIVPENARFIHVAFVLSDDMAGAGFLLREKGNEYDQNKIGSSVQVANVANLATGFVSCDNSRKIQYWAANTTWTVIQLTIRGWMV